MVDADWRPSETLANQVTAALQDWRQGDVITPGYQVVLADAAMPLTPESAAAADGKNGLFASTVGVGDVVLVTQTCDVVKDVLETSSGALRPFVQVAPLVRLEDQELAYARSGRSPRFAPVPGAGEAFYADLERCTTVEKAVLLKCSRQTGCPDDTAALIFARAVSRNRGRFAFPNEVERSLRKVKQRLIDKVGKSSPEGRRVDEVVQIRAAADPSWTADIFSVILWFLVIPQSLPPFDENEHEGSADIADWLVQNPSIASLAERLDGPDLSPTERSLVWQQLVGAWSASAMPEGPVAAISAVAESYSTFSLAQADMAPELDLQHFSMGDL